MSEPDTTAPNVDVMVTVCDSCLQASCWQCAFTCENAETAGTKEMPLRKLQELALESPDYWTSSIPEDDRCVRDPLRLCDCWVRLSNGKVCPLGEE